MNYIRIIISSMKEAVSGAVNRQSKGTFDVMHLYPSDEEAGFRGGSGKPNQLRPFNAGRTPFKTNPKPPILRTTFSKNHLPDKSWKNRS